VKKLIVNEIKNSVLVTAGIFGIVLLLRYFVWKQGLIDPIFIFGQASTSAGIIIGMLSRAFLYELKKGKLL
jgi:lipid-A-disaccharide synthase-like uncharacterized protein